MEAPILLLLFLAIAVMAAYFYVKRAQTRDAGHSQPSEAVEPPVKS